MDKQTQDLAWRCLPKEVRDEIKSIYTAHVKRQSITSQDTMLDKLFGRLNLTSNEEPSELLFVERSEVVDLYATMDKAFPREAAYSVQEALKALFGDKCLPDKEPSVQREKMFNKGDLVKCRIDGQIYEVEREHGLYHYWLKGKDNTIHINWLEPYTEPEYRNLSQNIANCDKSEDNQLKDNMEEKELDIYELLESYGDVEQIYSVIHDAEVDFKLSNRYIELMGLSYYSNGSMYDVAGRCMLYPSRDLYEKYPLDAYSAWMEWKESRTRRVHVDIDIDREDNSFQGIGLDFDFESEEIAQKAIDAVRATLASFAKK